MEKETLKTAAFNYWQQGYQVVPLKEKNPLIEWKKWQAESQSIQDLEEMPWDRANAFAIICGVQLNNGLYVGALDYDTKNVTPEAKEKGKQILRQHFPITQIEETPSGGQHWIYLCHNLPKTVSAYHNDVALELIGENKLLVMAPSHGYKRLNDNNPTEVQNLNLRFEEALQKAGVKRSKPKPVVLTQTVNAKDVRVRPCFQEAVRSGGLPHEMRVAITIEYLHAGTKREEIIKLFRRQADFDEGKTRYHVEHIARQGYKRFKCESIQSLGFCIGEACLIFRKSIRRFEREVDAL